MKPLRTMLVRGAVIAAVLALVSCQVGASEYLFGGGGNMNFLDLGFSDASTTTLDTNTSTFDAGTCNQGWWNKEGNSASSRTTNDNYIVGDVSNDGTALLNNFFTFDISSLDGTVTSATLRLRRFTGASSSGATSHTYWLYDVSTDPAVLNNNVGFSAAIYEDLGSGVNYGSFAVSVAGSFNEILSFTLNAAALADLNAAILSDDQYFSIGGTLAPVPEPSSFALAGLAIACGWAFRRHCSRHRAVGTRPRRPRDPSGQR